MWRAPIQERLLFSPSAESGQTGEIRPELHSVLRVSPAREIILGEVVGLFVRSDALDPSNLHIDQQVMDVVGRMGGHTYARTRDQFDIKTKSKEEWADQTRLRD